MAQRNPLPLNTLGWREWVSLPELGIPALKAKVDTGAKTSALHAFRIQPVRGSRGKRIHFWVHPLRRRRDVVIECEAEVADRRKVKDSGGHAEERYIIVTPVRAGDREWSIELSLTSRDDMLFRMLLGRSAVVEGGFTVDPSLSYRLGRKPPGAYQHRGER